MDVDIEMRLETVIVLNGDDAEILAQIDNIKENWLDFISSNSDKIKVSIYCEELEN